MIQIINSCRSFQKTSTKIIQLVWYKKEMILLQAGHLLLSHPHSNFDCEMFSENTLWVLFYNSHHGYMGKDFQKQHDQKIRMHRPILTKQPKQWWGRRMISHLLFSHTHCKFDCEMLSENSLWALIYNSHHGHIGEDFQKQCDQKIRTHCPIFKKQPKQWWVP